MKQIRHNVFETNSSSTHSIAIPKEHKDKYPNYIYFNIGEFGWGLDEVNPADYLYTAILELESTEREEKLNFLKETLDEYGIEYRMEEPRYNEEYHYLEYGYIDHSGELYGFLEAVFESKKTLLDFIFYGLVFTGNDNSDAEEGAYVARNHPTYTYWECNPKWFEEERENPYYKPEYENYNWYYKGN